MKIPSAATSMRSIGNGRTRFCSRRRAHPGMAVVVLDHFRAGPNLGADKTPGKAIQGRKQ
jgi:hypothetical protein